MVRASSQCSGFRIARFAGNEGPYRLEDGYNTQDALRPSARLPTSGGRLLDSPSKSSRARNICGTALQRPFADATTASP